MLSREIKATRRHHLGPIRRTIIKKKQEQKLASVGKNVERENPCMLLMGMEFGEATKQAENSMEVPQIIKHRTAI